MAVRNVLVTGCSSGIGLALAVRLARDELKRFRGKPRNFEEGKEALPNLARVMPYNSWSTFFFLSFCHHEKFGEK